MRIMHVLPTLTVGGAETMVVDYLIHMKQMGHDVALLVLIDTGTVLRDKLLKCGIEIFSITKCYTNKKYSLFVKSIARKLLKKSRYWKFVNCFKPDVMHFHLRMLPSVKDLEKYGGIKLFYTYHSDINRYIRDYGAGWKKNIEVLSQRGALCSFVLSASMLEQVERIISHKNVYYLPNGIDINGKKRLVYDRGSFLKNIKKEDSDFVLIHVGRMHEVKNHKKSVSILHSILKHKHNAILLIVGTGDTTYIENVKKYAAELGIADNVIFMGFRTDISELISVCDAAVLPSYYEGFPLTALEYQVHDVRTVVSNAVPMEAICNNNCFRMDVNDDDEHWAMCLLGDDVRDSIGNLMEFDISTCISRMLDFYFKG